MLCYFYEDRIEMIIFFQKVRSVLKTIQILVQRIFSLLFTIQLIQKIQNIILFFF